MKQKNVLIAICLVLLLAMPVLAQESDSSGGVVTIGGFGVGYIVDGPDETSVTTYYFAGVRAKKISETSAVFVIGQKYGIDESDISGTGLRGLYAAQMKAIPSISVLIGLGFLSNVAEDSDSTLTTGVTVDGGFAWNLAEKINIGLYGFGVDRGDNFAYSIHAFASITDPLELLTGLVPGL